MSNERLVRMYREELEYLCGKYSRDHYIYCYDRTIGLDLSFKDKKQQRIMAIDIGLLCIHIVAKPKLFPSVYNGPGHREAVYSEKKNKKVVLKYKQHKFEIYRLSNISAISMYVGTEE